MQPSNTHLEAQKTPSLSPEVIASLAHDIKNTLCVAQGHIEIEDIKSTQAPLTQVREALNKANELLENLLTYINTGHHSGPKDTDLQTLIQSTLALTLNNTDIRYHCHLPSQLPIIYLNPLELYRIIQNLLINAKQAMNDKGDIFITGYTTPSNATHFTLKIQDTGPGFSEEIAQKIFNKGFTTKPYGHGLGLSSAKNFLKTHQGDITAIASPGEGGTFILTLPIKQAISLPKNPKTPPTPKNTLNMRKNRGRILILDDDELLTCVAKEMLQLLGYETQTTKKSEDAIQMYQKAKETGAPFSSVILDLTLPGELDGEKVLNRLKSYDPEVKAFLSTGHTHHPIVKKFDEHGFTGCILKPYHLEDLDKALSNNEHPNVSS